MQGDGEKQFKSRSYVRYNSDAFIEESGHREAVPLSHPAEQRPQARGRPRGWAGIMKAPGDQQTRRKEYWVFIVICNCVLHIPSARKVYFTYTHAHTHLF